MICPYCKEEVADGAIKCKHCSSMLAQVNPSQANPAQINPAEISILAG